MKIGRLQIRKIDQRIIISWGGKERPSNAKSFPPKSSTTKPDEEVTKEFLRSFISGGTIAADCDFCGRTIYVDGGLYSFGEPGELQEAIKNCRENPDKFLMWYGDVSLEIGHLDGRQFVVGCPCNKVTPYERFIWNYRWQIADYLRLRTNSLRKNVLLEIDNIASIPKNLPK